MKTAGNLVVLGSINADHILNLNSFPTPGETVTGSHYQVAFGGKGANQAVAAGRSGANIAFIACTGDDDIGESVRKQLAKDNIDIAPISVISGHQKFWRTGEPAGYGLPRVQNSSSHCPVQPND